MFGHENEVEVALILPRHCFQSFVPPVSPLLDDAFFTSSSSSLTFFPLTLFFFLPLSI
jgi:hypothetical protein